MKNNLLKENKAVLPSQLIEWLEIGEKSGFVENFNRNKFLKDIHNKYLSK
jgi:hypothetical protein